MENKIKLDLLIYDLTHKEKTKAATLLKIELIKELINKPVSLVSITQYYYKILNLNGE